MISIPPKVIIVVLSLIAWNANAPIYIPNGFLSGNGFLARSEIERHAYVIGLLDGLLAAPMMGGDQAMAARLKSCVDPMNSAQILAIFENYLRGNPQIWHYDAQVLFWNAMSGACPGLTHE